MTLDTQIREFQNYARNSLQSGQPSQALSLLTQARELDPESAPTLMLQAIAMSRLNQPAMASETFAQAVALAPFDAKILYNYAVHLYSFGFRAEALETVRRGLEVNPEHPASQELARRLEGEDTAGLRSNSPPRMAAVPRGGYEEVGVHTIPFLGRVSVLWSGIGWTLAALSFVAFIFAISQLLSAGSSSDFMEVFTAGAAYAWLQGLYVFSLVATVLYGAVDLIDRRGTFAWLIPLVLMPLVLLGWLALPLYLLSRAK